MPGISPVVITHTLNVNPNIRLVRKKKRKFAYDIIKAIKEKTNKLLQVDFIKKVQYPD